MRDTDVYGTSQPSIPCQLFGAVDQSRLRPSARLRGHDNAAPRNNRVVCTQQFEHGFLGGQAPGDSGWVQHTSSGAFGDLLGAQHPLQDSAAPHFDKRHRTRQRNDIHTNAGSHAVTGASSCAVACATACKPASALP